MGDVPRYHQRVERQMEPGLSNQLSGRSGEILTVVRAKCLTCVIETPEKCLYGDHPTLHLVCKYPGVVMMDRMWSGTLDWKLLHSLFSAGTNPAI